ncbi:VOC family protein [Roseovarius spongiae]|uniref:VOC family protein n=1 Tax=Roseovarius spongiae TaxID=2320272 RepID=A0A3A8AR25_9RHOB|nr:VOC family protein [Roseovarius spongiae]RKF12978.1 VOC family protein [Roseovarius spongiae]
MPHFEIHADDVPAAKAFYGGLFGWRFDAMKGGDAVAYHLVEGSDIGADKALSGGILKRADGPGVSGGPIRGGVVTFEVADCDERYAWALANGGAEALPPADYPGIGRCAYVEDGQGNVVGMITPQEGR